MKTIEEFLHLKNEISMRKLVYSKYKYSWKFISTASLLGGVVLSLYGICIGIIFLKGGLLYSLGLIFIFSSTLFVQNRTTKIMQRHYKKFLINGKWDNRTINSIRKEIILNEMEKGNFSLSSKKLHDIIGFLERDIKINKYKYPLFTKTTTILFSVCTGSFLSEIAKSFDNLSELETFYGKIVGLIILFIVILFSFESILGPTFIDLKKRKYRLIRVLENIYLENIQE